MSKMDNLRAMREARYAEAQKRSAGAPAARAARPPVAPTTEPATKPAPRSAPKSAPKSATKPAAREAAPAPAAEPVEELCGHRNMSGRTCTRERGHAAKSHRYS